MNCTSLAPLTWSAALRIARRIDRVVVFERRKELAPRGKALLRSWKRVHVPFSIALLGTMLVHIAIALLGTMLAHIAIALHLW